MRAYVGEHGTRLWESSGGERISRGEQPAYHRRDRKAARRQNREAIAEFESDE